MQCHAIQISIVWRTRNVNDDRLVSDFLIDGMTLEHHDVRFPDPIGIDNIRLNIHWKWHFCRKLVVVHFAVRNTHKYVESDQKNRQRKSVRAESNFWRWQKKTKVTSDTRWPLCGNNVKRFSSSSLRNNQILFLTNRSIGIAFYSNPELNIPELV